MKFRFRKDLKIDVTHFTPEALLFFQDSILNNKYFIGTEKKGGVIDVDGTLMSFQKHWLIPIKEKTEAEKWVEDNLFKPEKSREEFIQAHNAGQEFATAATHEIYKPLMNELKPLIHIFSWLPVQDVTEIMKKIRSEYAKINKNN